MMQIALEALAELQRYSQWVCWKYEVRDGKPTKPPFNPKTGGYASSTNASTWASHKRALDACKSGYEGIGFALTKDDSLGMGVATNLVGGDLDACVDQDGKISEWAMDVVRIINTYTEISPSGTGLRFIARGSLPAALKQDLSGQVEKLEGINKAPGIEMYDQGRYLTITGKWLPGTPTTIEDRPNELLAIFTQYKKKTSTKQKNTATTPLALSDHELLQKMFASKLGSEIKALWNGTHGIEDESRADYELLSHLAFWTGKDASRMESLFNQSAQGNREKWSERADYRQRTINAAINACSEVYTPTRRESSSLRNENSGSGGTTEHKIESVEPQRFNLTDLGNGERFALKYRNRVRWCAIWNTWMIFNGKSWEPDRAGRVDQLAKSVVRSIYSEASAEPDEMERKRIAKHAAASESNRSVRAMLDRAKSELPVLPEEFNTHLYLINCENGTLDLRNGELHPHSPGDMLTRCLKIKYNPLAICQKWENFIDGIFASDQGLIAFMQQALGMSLCGDTSEQCLFICHGNGSNGKTTMLETIRIIMASYALAANIETFQMKKHEGIGNDVAELYGARFVTASENALGSRLNEAFIKKATGKEPLRARRLHENEFEFMPEFSIWFAVNHKPEVKDTSKGMWRRVHFIPFNVTIEGDKLDKHLGEKLLEESEGILAWLVQGCVQWYKQGKLVQPQAVKDATKKYQNEMDVVAKFLDENCEESKNAEIGATELYKAYKKWCEENGERYEKQMGFGLQLAEKGYTKEKTRTVIVYRGLRLISVDTVDTVDTFPDKNTRIENTRQKTSERCPQVSTVSTNCEAENEVSNLQTSDKASLNGSTSGLIVPLEVQGRQKELLSLYEQVSTLQIVGKLGFTTWTMNGTRWTADCVSKETYLARIDEMIKSGDARLMRLAKDEMTKRLEDAAR